MKAEEFAYWLQGALEMNPGMLKKGMTAEQVQTIQDHLNLVFNKVTPDRFHNLDVDKLIKEDLKTSPEERQKLMFENNEGVVCNNRPTVYC